MIFKRFLNSKIHGIKVTRCDLNYNGSITLDPRLMIDANIQEFEEVQILNKNNGERFTTYAIEGEPGSKVCCLNGPAARLVQIGDTIIILTYCLTSEKFNDVTPTIITEDMLKEMGYP